MAAEVVSSVRCFRGYQNVYKHHSDVLNCDMHFGAYIPDHKESEHLPGLFYLSGLTCTHANFMEKSGFQRFASGHGLIVIHPDTSPRGVDLPSDSDSWDFGKGAGFYVDATEEPWSKHYKMYSYIIKELPEVIKNLLPINLDKLGIFGHSMGGHGAISIGLKNPDLFKSISAFAPICNPMNCPWGQKAFKGYLGMFFCHDTKSWEQYDSSLLLKTYDGPPRKVLIDQGASDSFLPAGQLLPESLKSTDKVTVELRMQPDYDHSYYFIATFIGDHFAHHSVALKQ
ncbi:S-formylglutathione hydrolase [Necator americanus]|uniref:S-formylglutathione hydrolase n=1 Tax=Necator americanus TaxID=51031 RepID=W2TYU0_NECAM|nr:S-formylglutathione hydrolase [Necator americanus]ETN86814.1 S-formylglutathione hydrolase [Necator americanus]